MKILEALTTLRSCEKFSMERIELLGDSVLIICFISSFCLIEEMFGGDDEDDDGDDSSVFLMRIRGNMMRRRVKVGFFFCLSRKATKGGKKVIARRVAKGRFRITA
ncbi:uncharacterized protein LOC131600143 [Vicia villosa]|uniref:uncharacterized protein LOC131600143 n=1 Tax=Vicia villosa TaxID=3911 RepID=UPI00273ADF9D|nr:uncharacterized protein LOC131600143 [Vicia villosa]